jgi:hypothetical protein
MSIALQTQRNEGVKISEANARRMVSNATTSREISTDHTARIHNILRKLGFEEDKGQQENGRPLLEIDQYEHWTRFFHPSAGTMEVYKTYTPSRLAEPSWRTIRTDAVLKTRAFFFPELASALAMALAALARTAFLSSVGRNNGSLQDVKIGYPYAPSRLAYPVSLS